MAENLTVPMPPEDRLRQAFNAYNRNDAEALLAMVSDDVSWATDREPMRGKQELRSYWDRQWQRIRTHDRVVRIEHVLKATYDVTLEQIVRSLDGTLLSTGSFTYRFVVENGLIKELQSITASPT